MSDSVKLGAVSRILLEPDVWSSSIFMFTYFLYELYGLVGSITRETNFRRLNRNSEMEMESEESKEVKPREAFSKM